MDEMTRRERFQKAVGGIAAVAGIGATATVRLSMRKTFPARKCFVALLAALISLLVLGPLVAQAADFTGTWHRGDEVIELRANKTGVYKNNDTGEETKVKWSTTDKDGTINIYYSSKRTWTAQINEGEKSIFVKKGTGKPYEKYEKK